MVNAVKQNVPMVKPKLRKVFSKGWNNKMAAAITKPAFAALMPSREARIGLNFFRLSQIRIIKKIRKVPGKKSPAADMMLPKICPPNP